MLRMETSTSKQRASLAPTVIEAGHQAQGALGAPAVWLYCITTHSVEEESAVPTKKNKNKIRKGGGVLQHSTSTSFVRLNTEGKKYIGIEANHDWHL